MFKLSAEFKAVFKKKIPVSSTGMTNCVIVGLDPQVLFTKLGKPSDTISYTI